MRYCDANIPVMDKIYNLVKMVHYALLSSQTVLNDEGLWGSMINALYNDVSKEMSAVFGNSEEEDCFSDEELRFKVNIKNFPFLSCHFTHHF